MRATQVLSVSKRRDAAGTLTRASSLLRGSQCSTGAPSIRCLALTAISIAGPRSLASSTLSELPSGLQS